MAGFRLNDGSGGCPPTATPPAGYEIPFRFDSAGRLWITSCFKNLRFFGAARQDINTIYTIGQDAVPLSTAPDIISGNGITAGVNSPINITNDTECDMGILLGYDLFVDQSTRIDNMVRWTLSGRFNGANVDTISVSSMQSEDTGGYLLRQQVCSAANPHDPGVEAGGAPTLTLAPGASATIGVRLFVQYVVGSPDGSEVVTSAGAAVRAYGYMV